MVAATLEAAAPSTIVEQLPRHMTYVSWFELPDKDQEAFFLMLDDVVRDNRPPRPAGGSLLEYGDESLGRQYVRRFDQVSPGFNSIQDFYAQAAIYEFVHSVDPAFDSPYFGEHWHPHTSPELDEGEIFAVNSLTVFQKNRKLGKKMIIAALPWRIDNEATS